MVCEFSLVSLTDKGGKSLRQVGDVTGAASDSSVAGDYETNHACVTSTPPSMYSFQHMP